MEDYKDFGKQGENRMQLFQGELVYLENVHENTILTVSEKELLQTEEKMYQRIFFKSLNMHQLKIKIGYIYMK